jgi:membrane protein DedA with SNARE-associated domain
VVDALKKVQPLDYVAPSPVKRVKAIRYVIATLVSLFVVPALWFMIGVIIESFVLPREAEPLTGILIVGDAILSLVFGVVVFRAITRARPISC